MTTDGFLTDCPRELILRDIHTPFLNAFKEHIRDSGLDPETFLELIATTHALFSWKTRGQYALDHGMISAFAGLQKPPGDHESVKAWLLKNVANDGVKTLHEIRRLSSLVEVYKGAPFLSISFLKYISTQFDFKRKPVPFRDECIASVPWRDIPEMEMFLKRYVASFPYKVNSAEALTRFEQHIKLIENRRKVERTRKRRLEEPFRVDSLYPKTLRLCVRCALQGASGFHKSFTHKSFTSFVFTASATTHAGAVDAPSIATSARTSRGISSTYILYLSRATSSMC